jgi:hypothetical protein
MKDLLGNELNIGDEVLFVRQNYRDFLRGGIVAFTPKFVRVSYAQGDDVNEILQHASQLIKIPSKA